MKTTTKTTIKRWVVVPVALLCTVLFAAESCDEEEQKSDSHEKGQALTEKAFDQQSKAVPYPADDLRDSIERRNLRERLLRQNDPDRIGYVYILSFGKFIGYYTIKGKVSSTQSQMTPSDLTTRWDCGAECGSELVLEAPGDDGSYGPNEPGIFFFTTDGTMVQVSTDYIYSDQPLSVNNVPELNS